MIEIKKFTFNPFQENTFVLNDQSRSCVIIDPGCYEPHEEEILVNYIDKNKLTPERLIYTHCHVDHVLGNNFVVNKFGIFPEIHKEGLPFLLNIHEQGKLYGFNLEKCIQPKKFIEHGDEILFGESKLRAVYTPGHVDGSLCFISDEQEFVISGDVLFRDSIGRTDFPTGNFDLLMKSIHTELFTLDDDYTVYCGHGPETSIGYEKVNNPFIRF